MQVIVDNRPRDHLPVCLEMNYRLYNDSGQQSSNRRDWNAITKCYEHGDKKSEFVKEVTQELNMREEALMIASRRPTPDETWRIICEEVVLPTAVKYFMKDKAAEEEDEHK